MPEVEGVATICSASPLPTPGAIRLPSETLAGAWMACAGTLLPSGRVGSGLAPAAALDALTPRRLAVQAADSSAIGTSAVALCRRPNRLADMWLLSPNHHRGVPSRRPSHPTNRVTDKLRASTETVTPE